MVGNWNILSKCINENDKKEKENIHLTGSLIAFRVFPVCKINKF